jgi:hypothetical protein
MNVQLNGIQEYDSRMHCLSRMICLIIRRPPLFCPNQLCAQPRTTCAGRRWLGTATRSWGADWGTVAATTGNAGAFSADFGRTGDFPNVPWWNRQRRLEVERAIRFETPEERRRRKEPARANARRAADLEKFRERNRRRTTY